MGSISNVPEAGSGGKAFDLLTRARTNMLINSPFFGSLAMRLKLQEDYSEPTFAVDGVSVFYNPEFVSTLSIDEIKTVLAHEVLHVLLGHHERRGERDPADWNRAADYAINPLLDKDPNYQLPKGALLSQQFYDKAAEEIYSEINRKKPKTDGGSGSKQKQGKGDSTNRSGTGTAGSGKPDPLGRVKDKPKNAPAGASQESWKGAAVSALRKDSVAGSVSAQIKEMVGELVDPKVTWQERLKQFMTAIAQDDFSWSRPNRRFIGSGLYLPSAYSEQLGNVVVAIDVSGSVNKPLLNRFMSELFSIFEETRFESLRVLQCNTKVTKDQTFYPDDDLDISVVGGGGTRVSPVFEEVGKGQPPEVLIYFTDLAIPPNNFPVCPSYPVLWVEPEKRSKYRKQPSFGECLEIS